MSERSERWREAAARAAGDGQPVKAQMFRNVAFEIECLEQEEACRAKPVEVEAA